MITVLGSINLDLIGAVTRLPAAGETVLGQSFRTAPGGKGANQALAAKRAGAAVRMIGAVGRDAFCEPALALLREGGVDLQSVKSVQTPTGVALILVGPDGENVIAVIPGANDTLTEVEAARLEFSSADMLLAQLEIPVAAIEAGARRAREAGAAVLLNFAPFRADALRLIELVSHLVVNESECTLIADALGIAAGGIEQRAMALAGTHSAIVVLTMGEKGSLAVAGGETTKVPTLKVEALDAVGAGDTFCGYLAAALSEGMALREGLRLASAAAALACTAPGAQPSVPMRSDAEAAARSMPGST